MRNLASGISILTQWPFPLQCRVKRAFDDSSEKKEMAINFTLVFRDFFRLCEMVHVIYQ